MKIPTGALLDNRPQDEIEKDYLHEEIAAGFEPYVWREGRRKEKYYYPYNQHTSLSCVAGAGAIVLEHHDGNVVSRKDIYNGRANYPLGGMSMPDIMKLLRRGGALESTVPSQGLGETKMNERYAITPQIITERDKNRAGVSVMVSDFRNIDTLASIAKHVPLIMFWYFDEAGKEWWREQPTPIFNFANHLSFGVARHGVAGVDPVLESGEKVIYIQDSADLGSGLGEDYNLRRITQDMINKRLYAVGYILDNDDEKLEPVNIPVRPVFSLTATVKVGDTGSNVRKLQDVLIYEGLLKIKASTGWFGGMTLKAVKELQTKYKADILTPLGLKYATGLAGPSTLKFLRNKYK